MEQMFVGGPVNGLKSGSPESDQPTIRNAGERLDNAFHVGRLVLDRAENRLDPERRRRCLCRAHEVLIVGG
jgi:hypothetical protein